MMKYSEIERYLHFGFNLVSLKLEIVAHEQKGDLHPYPEVHVREILKEFENTYREPTDAPPVRLESSDIPEKFSSIIKRTDPIASLIMTSGYDIGFWWQAKSHGDEIQDQLEENLERISMELNAELPGIRTRISDVIAQYRDVAFSREVTPELLDQVIEQTALAIDEHFEQERKMEGVEMELQYSLNPAIADAFEKEFGEYRAFEPPSAFPIPEKALEEGLMEEETKEAGEPEMAEFDTVVKVCSECGSSSLVRDYEHNELVCKKCGLVFGESFIDKGPEWGAFDTERTLTVAKPPVIPDPDKVDPKKDPETARRILENPQSRFTIFEHPFVLPLLPYLNAAKEKIPPDITVLINQYDIYSISYSFGAMPRGKEKFTELDLYLDYPDGQGFLTHTLVPNTELEERFTAEVKGLVALNPHLDVGSPDIELAPGVGVGGGFRASTEAEFLLHWSYKVLRAKVIARGKNNSYAQWVIIKPERMVGDVDFSTIMCVPKGAKELPVTVCGSYTLNRKIKWWKKRDIPYDIKDVKRIVQLPQP